MSIPGVPEYYVAWMQADRPYLVVGDTATGKQVGEVAPLLNVDLEGIYGAAADDRTFIVVGDRLFGPPGKGRTPCSTCSASTPAAVRPQC